ncbi:regulatory protein RecX [Roseisolibacter sp. H3M3-2]|uniref:regulatory protein RecX n=1 Tax=Roseisolibacter sp. H3M3-2 TaxID=3031323 RepID=UPI0023DCB8AB|nr:regulatory protein RecX [Roseisolibacter sp. H3M3-2]MDF1505011.1 regulatory protein RecX [Roseisolibacter sp. H3M3-2]
MRGRQREVVPEELPPIAGVVTAIVAAPRRPGRFELAVDGRSACVVSVDVVERLGLRVGLTLAGAAGQSLAEEARALATYDRAVGLLAVQGRSARELARKLKQRGERERDVAAAIAKLTAAGLVDDAQYARQLARSRVGGRGDSRRRVSQVLAQKGVTRDVADAAVAEVFAEESVDEEALAEASAWKKARALAGEDAPTQRRRLYGYLARRGHDGEIIRRVLARVLGAGADDSEIEDGGDVEPS